jgi:hypothetical protein
MEAAPASAASATQMAKAYSAVLEGHRSGRQGTRTVRRWRRRACDRCSDECGRVAQGIEVLNNCDFVWDETVESDPAHRLAAAYGMLKTMKRSFAIYVWGWFGLDHAK